MARLSLTAKAGIILIAGPCLWLASWALWHYTRSWEPVDIPISLAPGHISTSIKIKFESDYAIYIYLGTREEDYVRVPCSGGSGECYLDLTMIQATWSVGSGGKVGVDGAGPVSARLMKSPSGWGAALGRFHADRGIYMLDWISSTISAHSTRMSHTCALRRTAVGTRRALGGAMLLCSVYSP